MAKLKQFIIRYSLFIILVLAAFMRLYRISEYMTFLGDEGRDVLVVKRMLVDHKWTLLGPTASVGGFFLGPIYYYFMLPFLWAWRLDPVGPAIMVALFGMATVYLIYRVGQEFFGKVGGLMAASLYALSPLVIVYSRSSWNPNLVPFFSLFYIWSLYQIVKTNRWQWWLSAGVSLGIGLQLHYLFTFLIPMGAAFLLIYKRKKADLKLWGIKVLGGIAGWSPFLLFELRHGFPNARTIYDFIFRGKETGFVAEKLGIKLADIVFRLFGRLPLAFPSPEHFYRYDQQRWLLESWRWGVIFLLVSALALLLWQTIKKRRPDQLLLLFWLVFGVGLFSFYRRAVYDYYLGIMFALPFLLVTNLLVFLSRKKILHGLAVFLFISLLLVNWWQRPIKSPGNNLVLHAQQVADFILEWDEDQPLNFALITANNSDHAYRYFLETGGNPPVVIQTYESDPERESVTDQLWVVCEMDECKPLGHPLWEIAGFGRAEIIDQGQVNFVTIMKLVHWQGEDEIQEE